MRSPGSSTRSRTTRMPTAPPACPRRSGPATPTAWASKKRATLGSAIVLTSPGIPMLFQGQELVEGSWFNDEDGLDWTLRHRHAGLLRLHRDLISLRRNTTDVSRGLRGEHVTVHHVNATAKVLAWHRWLEGGPRDDVDRPRQLLDRRLPGLPRRRPAAGPLAGPVQQRLGRLRPGVRDRRLARCGQRARGARRDGPADRRRAWGRTRS